MHFESELVLIRHGETRGQSSIRLYGATDIDLSPIGERQARAAGTALIGERFDLAVTSPLCRAHRSAEIVRHEVAGRDAASAVPTAERVDGLREIDFGAWEGWTVEEIAQRDPEGHRAWRETGDAFRFPRGEGRTEFRRRVTRAVKAAIAAPCGQGPTRMLGVLHKGVIKIAIAELTGLDPAATAELPINLGSIHRLRFRQGVWTLTEPNRVDHLSGELLQAHS